ncbi:hypothetical protein FQA47_017162 [Oryzias melastigma]|uniref:Uncharacterized protein n=1 Tax=Oryzias melastigma TaxID=30732 RepID=A0A834CB39_ORYME|nr:hypothetical protein FQA47_017162 [Oryzias melastigma]
MRVQVLVHVSRYACTCPGAHVLVCIRVHMNMFRSMCKCSGACTCPGASVQDFKRSVMKDLNSSVGAGTGMFPSASLEKSLTFYLEGRLGPKTPPDDQESLEEGTLSSQLVARATAGPTTAAEQLTRTTGMKQDMNDDLRGQDMNDDLRGVHAPGGGVTYPRKCAFIFTTLESRSRTDPFDVSASILQSAESPGTGPNFDEPNPRVAAGRSARRSRADRAETSGNETTGATLKFSCCAETLTASLDGFLWLAMVTEVRIHPSRSSTPANQTVTDRFHGHFRPV